jgi:DNA (cytosine-5)-methyltransferase 1
MPEKKFKIASFFAGIGGFDLGFERCGMETVFQCEIDKYCQKVLKKHWPDVPLKNDILNLKPSDIPDADLWCGGFPCQDLSLANQGKRKGLGGNRSGLFFKYAELIKARNPSWVIIENVPGLLNSYSGEDFKILLQTLDEYGYGVSWRVLDAKYFGTPQRRRRVYIIGSYGSLKSAQVLFEQGGVEIAPRQGLGKKEVLAKKSGEAVKKTNAYSIQHASIGRKPEAGPQAKGYRDDGETYTLDSRGGADAVCKKDGSFRVRNTSGVPGRMDGNRYRAVGNAVCVHVVEWLGKRILAAEGLLSEQTNALELAN